MPGEEPDLSVNERERLRQLERETRELRMENEFLKKGRSVLRPGSSVSDTFEFIDAEYANPRKNNCPVSPPLTKMCAWLDVSRSGYYEWRNRPASATSRRREELKTFIVHFFDASDGTYGYRRVHADLAEHGIAYGLELIRALMRELGLRPCQPRQQLHLYRLRGSPHELSLQNYVSSHSRRRRSTARRGW